MIRTEHPQGKNANGGELGSTELANSSPLDCPRQQELFRAGSFNILFRTHLWRHTRAVQLVLGIGRKVPLVASFNSLPGKPCLKVLNSITYASTRVANEARPHAMLTPTLHRARLDVEKSRRLC